MGADRADVVYDLVESHLAATGCRQAPRGDVVDKDHDIALADEALSRPQSSRRHTATTWYQEDRGKRARTLRSLDSVMWFQSFLEGCHVRRASGQAEKDSQDEQEDPANQVYESTHLKLSLRWVRH